MTKTLDLGGGMGARLTGQCVGLSAVTTLSPFKRNGNAELMATYVRSKSNPHPHLT